MAKYNVPNYTSADGFGLPLNIRRGNPNPLDNSSVWTSLAAAENYAKTDPVAYVGQVITVVEFAETDTEQTTPIAATVYAIQNEAGDLARVGTITLGDNKSIVKNADNTLSIYGYADAEAGAQLTRTADGLAWVVPSTTTVEGLQTAVGGLTTRMSEAETAIADRYTKTEVDNKIASAGHLKRLVVTALPEVASADADTIYMVKDTTVTSGDAYKEYMLIDGALVQIGDTSINLDPYAKTADVTTAITNATKDLATASSVTELGTTVTNNKTATDAAIALKADQTTVDGIDERLEAAEGTIATLGDDYAAKEHDHQISEVDGLQDALNAKALATDLSTLSTTVDGKADKATTLAGYGITDAVDQTTFNEAIGTPSDAITGDTVWAAINMKGESIGALDSGKADKATTLAGYGITDAYTKDEVDSAISDATVAVENSLTSDSTTAALSAAQGKILDEKIKAINTNMEDLGAGDMLKSVYDTDNNGKVDDSDKLGGQLPAYYAKQSDMEGVNTKLGTANDTYIDSNSSIYARLSYAESNIGGNTGSIDALTEEIGDYATGSVGDGTVYGYIIGLEHSNTDVRARVGMDESLDQSWSAGNLTDAVNKLMNAVGGATNVGGETTLADAIEYLNTNKANSGDVYTKTEVDSMLTWGEFGA